MARGKRHPAIDKLYPFGGRPVPPHARLEIITTADGIDLRAARFPAPKGGNRGTVLIVQGRAEFIEKYYETVEDLRELGFAVVTFDLRGQGGSERVTKNPFRGHVGSFDQYGSDLDAVVEKLLLADCPPPYYAIGHSTGGAILLHAAEHLKTRIERLALSAPLMGLADRRLELAGRLIAIPLFWLGLGRLVAPTARLRPVLRSNPRNPDKLPTPLLSSDTDRYREVLEFADAHPELMAGPPTFGWIRAMIRSDDQLARSNFAETITIPTVIAVAGRETLVSNGAIDSFAQRMRVGRAIEFDGAGHEILIERPVHRDKFIGLASAFFVLSDTLKWEL